MNPIATIRAASIEDVPVLVGLVDQYWRFEGVSGFEPSRVALQLHRLLSQPSLGGGWIAHCNDRPVGYLLAVYVFSLEHLGLTAEIDELFVSPTARGIGVGGKLLRAAEATTRAAGCTNIALQLGRHNDVGRAFYLGHGYAPRSGYELLDKTLANSHSQGTSHV
jgi:GNAT superfamily N-acetyltransferase